MARANRLWTAASLALIAFAVASFLPPEVKNLIRSTDPQTAGLCHIIYHVLAFTALAFVLLSLCTTRRQKIAAMAGAVTLGISLELAQHLLCHAELEWWDMRDDTLGVLFGAVFHYAFTHMHTPVPATTPATQSFSQDLANLATALASFGETNQPAPASVKTAEQTDPVPVRR